VPLASSGGMRITALTLSNASYFPFHRPTHQPAIEMRITSNAQPQASYFPFQQHIIIILKFDISIKKKRNNSVAIIGMLEISMSFLFCRYLQNWKVGVRIHD
jgi:hypothetical protein